MKDKRLMEASWWERLTEGETGSCSDGPGHAQKIFNPIFSWWVELCSLPVIYLGPDYGGGNEDNGDLLQKVHACTATHSAPSPAAGHHRPAPPPETAGHSQASLGQSLVGSLLLSPGSWCAQGSVCALQESISQSCVSSGSSVVGLTVTSSQRAYAIPRSTAPKLLPLQQSTADPHLHRRHSNTVLSQSLWNPWALAHRLVWALLASLAGMGFDSKHQFTPPTVLLGLLLCPWLPGISSLSLQRLPSYWGFSDLGLGVSPQGQCSIAQPLLLTLDVG